MKELTYGDLILVEMLVIEKIKEQDLSLKAGQFMVELLGKIEYQLGMLEQTAGQQIPLEPEMNLPPIAGA